MPLELTTNANDLEEYLHDELTLPRHRELASLALSAFDAMSLLMTTRNGQQNRGAISKAHESRSPARAYGIQIQAIFMGVTLACGSSKNWAFALLED